MKHSDSTNEDNKSYNNHGIILHGWDQVILELTQGKTELAEQSLIEEPLPKNYLVRLWTYFLPQEKAIHPDTKQWLESKMPLRELVQNFTLPSNFWRAMMKANVDLIDNLVAGVVRGNKKSSGPNEQEFLVGNGGLSGMDEGVARSTKRNGQKRTSHGQQIMASHGESLCHRRTRCCS